MYSTFPPQFVFGASTSAYQIEGAHNIDGKGPSIWDRFSHQKGKIVNNDHGDIACDHYHKFQQDIGLMQQMQLQAYRLSLSWPRLQSKGKGKLNAKGVDFYQRLIDGLLEAGITPFVTLFHWDLPLALHQSQRGFISRQTSDDFADYVDLVVSVLGDRVKHWITLNEPFEHAAFGHLLGSHAPGHHSMKHFLAVMHHQLVAHGLATQRIKDRCPDSQVGITLSLTPILPVSEKPKDQWAAHFGNQLLNDITLSPLYGRGYPAELQQRLRWFWPLVTETDLATIATPTDFVGVNHYNCEYASYKWYVPFLKSWISGSKPGIGEVQEGPDRTAMGWEVNPGGLGTVLTWLRERYGNPPVYITENGAAYTDTVEKGTVNDTLRQRYLERHINEVHTQLQQGADIRGYFAWSLMDNFEWAAGYSRRFGLIHVDYATQQRIIKQSGHWYGEFIRQHKLGGGAL